MHPPDPGPPHHQSIQAATKCSRIHRSPTSQVMHAVERWRWNGRSPPDRPGGLSASETSSSRRSRRHLKTASTLTDLMRGQSLAVIDARLARLAGRTSAPHYSDSSRDAQISTRRANDCAGGPPNRPDSGHGECRKRKVLRNCRHSVLLGSPAELLSRSIPHYPQLSLSLRRGRADVRPSTRRKPACARRQ